MDGQVERLNRDLERQNDILGALCGEYVSIYEVDLDNETYEIYRVTNRLRGELARMVGASKDFNMMINAYIDNFVHVEDADFVRESVRTQVVRKQLEQNPTYTIRYRVKQNPQGLVYFDMQFADVGRANGPHKVILAFRNMDATVQREIDIKTSAQREAEMILRGSGIGTWRIEMEDGKPPKMFADATMKKLLGIEDEVTPEECFVRWNSRIDEGATKDVQKAIDTIKKEGTGEVTYLWHHPTLGEWYVRCGGTKDTTYEKKGLQIRGYHQNVTDIVMERKRQEKQLVKALMEAERANRAKTEFLANMSHDLKTPLNGILGMLVLANQHKEDEKWQEKARENIGSEAGHLLSLVNDVLEYSAIESSKIALASENFSLEQLCENCIDNMKAMSEEKQINLRATFGNIPYTWVIGSPIHIRQILNNLMSNAIRYNHTGGDVKLHVSQQVDEMSPRTALCVFRVEDTGIGMSAEFIKRMYEPFTQEQQDARTSYRGTGLGLAIVQELVSRMNGTIEVESTVGSGSVFTVKIPLNIGNDQKKKEIEIKQSRYSLEGLRILVVEDNRLNSEITQAILTAAKAEVESVDNGQKAVDKVKYSKEGYFDCILMDIMMPVMDGLEATYTIRALNRDDTKCMPIIALSANDFAEDHEKAKRVGISDYMGKPIDPGRLIEMIATFCGRIDFVK